MQIIFLFKSFLLFRTEYETENMYIKRILVNLYHKNYKSFIDSIKAIILLDWQLQHQELCLQVKDISNMVIY